MPSFQDSAFLVLLALLLFGPKGLAKLAREIGKLMGEFRRASNEFRVQMEDEFRISEQAEQQKKIAAIEAAAPVTPAFPAEVIPEPEHPHMPPPEPTAPPTLAEPEPIAFAGDLHMMPPATGLPTARSSSLSNVFDSIPHIQEESQEAIPENAPETTHHG